MPNYPNFSSVFLRGLSVSVVMMHKRIPLLIIILFICGVELHSQQYFFRRYSVEEGLPQASIYCLIQDSRGYIWMGTDGAGVARFDGRTSEVFTKANGMSDNIVRCIFEDSSGNIWFGTANGITVYNGREFSVIGKAQGLQGTTVLKIIEGFDGTIWAATNGGGLSAVSRKDMLVVKNFTTEDDLLNDFIFDIWEAPDRKLWLGMIGGLCIVEFKSDSLVIKNVSLPSINTGDIRPTVTTIEPGEENEVYLGTLGAGVFTIAPANDNRNYKCRPLDINDQIPGMLVWDIWKTGSGEMWIATNDHGVLRLKGNKLEGIFNKESGLLSNQILDILPDKEGNVWFASFGQGAMMYQNDKFIRYTESDGLKGNIALNILFVNDKDFYVATEEGLSLFRKDGTSIRRIKHYSTSDGLNSIGANTLTRKGEEIWIGTNNGINILRNSRLTSFVGNNKLGNSNINSIYADLKGDVWIGSMGGYGRIFEDNLFFMSQDDGLINDEIQAIIEDKKGRIWMATMGGLVRLDSKTYTDFDNEEGLSSGKISALAEDKTGNLWLGSLDAGIFRFDMSGDSMPVSQVATRGVLASAKINSLHFYNDTLLIAGNDKGFDLLVLGKDYAIKNVIQYGIKDGFTGGENSANSIVTDSEGLVWIGTKNGLMRYNPQRDFKSNAGPETRITDLNLFFEKVDWNARKTETSKWTGLPVNLDLSHKDNHLTFVFTAFEYDNPDDLQFSYYLENQSKEWSPFMKDRQVVFSGLNPGAYVFRVKAANKYGIEGNTAEYPFVIRPPFWQTPWFYIPAMILLVFAIIMIIRIREKNLIMEKLRLEKIVEERTREIVEQKDEIARQRDVVTYQKKEITDSIHYAERIQRAVLPDDRVLKKPFRDYFVLFRPKDIVSGDFYWMNMKNDHIIFTAADCTGHGVPGAFMSMLGVSFLNKIVNELGIVIPSDILNSLRSNIITALRQEGNYETTKDGMDIALCSVDLKNRKLMFAGANNPLFLIRKNGDGYELMETPADKMPIGYHSSMEPFTNNIIDIAEGDTIYLFSDGFCDQFGGPEGRKFMKKRFKEMLLGNQTLDMASQREVFNASLEQWIYYPTSDPLRASHAGQIDDIILLGVRF